MKRIRHLLLDNILDTLGCTIGYSIGSLLEGGERFREVIGWLREEREKGRYITVEVPAREKPGKEDFSPYRSVQR